MHSVFNLIETKIPRIDPHKYSPDEPSQRFIVPENRAEPCQIVSIIEILSKLYQIRIEELTKILVKNATDLFDVTIDLPSH